MSSFNKKFDNKDVTFFSKQNITSLKNCWWNDIYRLAWEYWSKTEVVMGMRKVLAHDVRMQKTPQTKRTLSGFLPTFMELCGSKVQLAPPLGNFINFGVANPEIVYMLLLLFQIPCIDYFLKKPLTLNENSLNI